MRCRRAARLRQKVSRRRRLPARRFFGEELPDEEDDTLDAIMAAGGDKGEGR